LKAEFCGGMLDWEAEKLKATKVWKAKKIESGKNFLKIPQNTK